MVPFVSKRALGLVCGFVGAGGNTGSAITQVLFRLHAISEAGMDCHELVAK